YAMRARAGSIMLANAGLDDRDGGRHGYRVNVRISADGQPTVTGTLWILDAVWEAVPGTTDAEKTTAIAERLERFYTASALKPLFALDVGCSDDGVSFVLVGD